MKKAIYFLLTLIITQSLVFANIDSELEGIWVLDGITTANFDRAPQYVFIERISEKSIAIFWYNAYFGGKNLFATMVIADNGYSGLTSEGDELRIVYPHYIDEDFVISIGYALFDERYDFIPLK